MRVTFLRTNLAALPLADFMMSRNKYQPMTNFQNAQNALKPIHDAYFLLMNPLSTSSSLVCYFSSTAHPLAFRVVLCDTFLFACLIILVSSSSFVFITDIEPH